MLKSEIKLLDDFSKKFMELEELRKKLLKKYAKMKPGTQTLLRIGDGTYYTIEKRGKKICVAKHILPY